MRGKAVFFAHTAEAWPIARRSLWLGLFLASFFGFGAAMTFIFGFLLFAIVFGLFSLASAIMFVQALFQLSAGGRWDIRVTEDRVVWSTPRFAGDESFDLPLGGVKKTIRKIKRKADGSPRKIKYYLVPRGRDPIRLLANSGIDLEAFTEAMRVAGIAIEDMEADTRPR
jgi:hypothetical protein